MIANYCGSEEQARALAAETGCLLCRADVSDSDGRSALLAFADEALGGIDVLVNNAGVALFGLFDALPKDEVQKLYSVNLTGTVELWPSVPAADAAAEKRRIVNVSSVWGTTGASCEVDYSASKAAVAGLTRALAREVGPSGVRVNCVAPGVIDTDMNGRLTYEEMLALTDEIPLMRLGTAEEAAKAIFFLASEDSAYITGQVLGVDGGFR